MQDLDSDFHILNLEKKTEHRYVNIQCLGWSLHSSVQNSWILLSNAVIFFFFFLTFNSNTFNDTEVVFWVGLVIEVII